MMWRGMSLESPVTLSTCIQCRIACAEKQTLESSTATRPKLRSFEQIQVHIDSIRINHWYSCIFIYIIQLCSIGKSILSTLRFSIRIIDCLQLCNRLEFLCMVTCESFFVEGYFVWGFFRFIILKVYHISVYSMLHRVRAKYIYTHCTCWCV